MKKKKIYVILALMITFLFSTAFTIYAHPGRTDSAGGHTNHSTGEYHYHHGYPAHQHPNGVCPYNFADATSDDSDSATKEKDDKNSGTSKSIDKLLFLFVFVIVGGGLFIYYGNKSDS